MADLNNCFYCDFSADVDFLLCDVNETGMLNLIPGVTWWAIQAWVKTTDNTGVNKEIVSRSLSGVANTDQYRIYGRNEYIGVTVGGINQEWDTSAMIGGQLNDGAWHHIVVTSDAATAAFYIDGVQGAPRMTLSTQEMAPAGTTVGVRLDTGMTTAVVASAWNGSIDEVAFWAAFASMSDTAVLALYNDGVGIDIASDSGSYVDSAALVAWYRMGDGTLENAAWAPTINVSDMSGNGATGALKQAPAGAISDGDVAVYHGADVDSPGNYCGMMSSSSGVPLAIPSFSIDRSDQGTLRTRDGFEGSLQRMQLMCVATRGVQNKIFVHEYGRPVVGSQIRRVVFRRVAGVRDLLTLPEDVGGSTYPFAYLSDEAIIYAATEAKLTEIWIEVQRQAAALSLDLLEFGNVVDNEAGDRDFRGGEGAATFAGRQVFRVPAVPVGSSSSSRAPVAYVPGSSSSSSWFSPPVLSSSSSWYSPLYEYTRTMSVDYQAGADAAVRKTDTDNGITLYTELDFIRFGRDIETNVTWDSFIRFPCPIPPCALIQSALLVFEGHTAEAGENVVIAIRSLHGPAQFSSTDDPAFSRTVIWDRIAATTGGTSYVVLADIAVLLQGFVDDPAYQFGTDYFGLWLHEWLSDVGARRDATISADATITLAVAFDISRPCVPSSSSSGWA